MNKIKFLKPDNQNLSTYLYSGSFLFFIAVLDVFLSSFFRMNITSFLPNLVSFLLPLILGIIGLHLIRIEFSGIKSLDLLNKHINTNTFNAVLTLLIIFTIIKSIPPIMSWFIIDANIAVIQKKLVLVVVLVGPILKSGLIDLFMECIQMNFNGE